MLYLRDIQMRYLVGAVFLHHSILLENEAFAGEILLFKRDFYTYSPIIGMDSGYFLSSNPKTMYFLESEAFAGVILVLRDISFLILLSLEWTSDIFSLLILKTCIFIKDSTGHKYSRLVKQSHIISYSSISFN